MEHTWPREIIVEAIEAHNDFIKDKPWMEKPRPLGVDVAYLEAMIAEIDLLVATEEGAQIAFAHVVEQKHEIEQENKKLRTLLDAAYADLRHQRGKA